MLIKGVKKMERIKIKETYLLILIVLGLVSIATYSTFALFTASTTIDDVVSFDLDLDVSSNLLEYEKVIVPAGETMIVEVNATNSHSEQLYYGVWYQMVDPSYLTLDVEIGLYTEKNNTPSSGRLASGASVEVLVGITNYSNSSIIVNIGTVGSIDETLDLNDGKILIPTNWSEGILVTDDYLKDYVDIASEKVSLEYTTPEMTSLTLQPGEYELEAWGAQGGSHSGTYSNDGEDVQINNSGGKGGHSYGLLTLDELTQLYVYVGGQAGSFSKTSGTSNAGGFNGGGNGYTGVSTVILATTTTYGTGGGGASDIRIGTDSLYARAIVAGGGSGVTFTQTKYAGADTTVSGKNGYAGGGETSEGSETAMQATQTTAGTSGTFGTGASTTSDGGPGGGGGWYGGGVTGGGSGYVYTIDTASNYPQGSLLDDKYYLEDAYTESDVWSGNGKVTITGKTYATYSIPTIRGLDEKNIFTGETVDLTEDIILVCGTDDVNCSLDRVNITDTSTLSAGKYIIYYFVSTSDDTMYRFKRILNVGTKLEYTDPKVTRVSLKPGTYKLEVWGAQGASYDATYTGGKGGYSYGNLTITESTPIYIYVGRAGYGGKTAFNGGGRVGHTGWLAGGGASDIRIGTDSLYARVIVAGGGGAASGSASASSYEFSGGYGGGLTGGDGGYTYSCYDSECSYWYDYYGGFGGTQIAGGSGGYNTYNTLKGIGGNFGTGGYSIEKTSTYDMSSTGGGGWYGGGSGTALTSAGGGGGGGSGWVYTADAFATWQEGNATDSAKYLLNSNYYLTNAETIAGNTSFTDFDGQTVTGHAGDGAVRITKLS